MIQSWMRIHLVLGSGGESRPRMIPSSAAAPQSGEAALWEGAGRRAHMWSGRALPPEDGGRRREKVEPPLGSVYRTQ